VQRGVGVRWGLEILDFCIVILAALDLDSGLNECSSIDIVRGKTQTVLNYQAQ